MLSGGMDSTTAAALCVPAIQSSGRGVAAYCWRFGCYPEADESVAIQATAKHLGVDVHWLCGDQHQPVLHPATWPLCPNTPQLNPFLPLNCAVYAAARSDGCDVLINGHLGDYLYPHRFHGLADAVHLRDLRQAGRELCGVIRRNGGAHWWRAPEIRDLIKRSLRMKRHPRAPAFLTRQAAEAFRDVPEWPPELHQVPHVPQWSELFGTISATETKAERYYAERAGVERRHPLRHWRIVSSVLALPSFLFFDGPSSKVLTRLAMVDRLPDQVLRSGANGNLNKLFLEGFFADDARILRELLADPFRLWPEFIRDEYVMGAVTAGRNSTAQQQRVLVAAAGIELWRRAVDQA
jgi:hypothetical protein